MFWSKRRRGGPRAGGGRHALLPIPLTGGLLSGEVRDHEGKPLAGAEMRRLTRRAARRATPWR